MPSDLDQTLVALAHPTRRVLLQRLAPVTELARPAGAGRNAHWPGAIGCRGRLLPMLERN
jgi:hypothetical protein